MSVERAESTTECETRAAPAIYDALAPKPAASATRQSIAVAVRGTGWSMKAPRLAALGNSVRGVEFSRRLTQELPFQAFSDVLPGNRTNDPRQRATEKFVAKAAHLCAAGSRDGAQELQRLLARGADVDRWGDTATDDARRDDRDTIVRLLASSSPASGQATAKSAGKARAAAQPSPPLWRTGGPTGRLPA